MKITTACNGNQALVITKQDWEAIGIAAGWLEDPGYDPEHDDCSITAGTTVEAKWGKETKPEQPGKWTNYSKDELVKKRNAARKRQEKRKEQGKKADPKDTELLRELNFAIRAKGGWGKAQ